VLGAALATPLSPALAGEVFGKIFDEAGSVGDTAAVSIQCGDKSYPPTRTDDSGAYHVVVKETGKCTLTVSVEERSASLGIASYDEAVQVDLVLETKDGKLTVRRR
jgi:hypothetical protein